MVYYHIEASSDNKREHFLVDDPIQTDLHIIVWNSEFVLNYCF